MFLATPAFAQLEIVDIASNGSGCPTGSVDVLLSSDAIALQFADFSVNTDRNTPIRTAGCSIAVGLRVTERVTVSINRVESMGLLTLEGDSTGVFSRQIFFVGDPPASIDTNFTSAFQTFRESDNVAGVTFSGCGGDQSAIARANTSFSLRGPGSAAVNAILIRFTVGSC
jgi:hypothetical protein